MSDFLVAALVLNFAGSMGAAVEFTPRHQWSRITFELRGVLVALGVISTFLALYLFIKDRGIIAGLLYWFISSVVYLAIAKFILMEGLRTVAGIAAAVIGGYLAAQALL
ncbi:hypothetical protein [Pseudolabrys sp.]|uniref:hypothetical protein n=1 Tax=Pseudolabrys sp. TaxID=1960880 RepID=UPI003D0B94B1